MNETISTEKQAETVMDALFKAGAHFGFGRSRRHPSIAPYIFGAKNGVDIINLEKTEQDLARAEQFVETLGREGKKILFSGNKPEVRALLKASALQIDMPYVAERWIGGTFTNFPEIKKRIARMKELREGKARDNWAGYVKKEKAVFQKELDHLERFFLGIEEMSNFPSAVLVVDSRNEAIAVDESNAVKIPVISISGSDCDITGIAYPVVANDSSSLSVRFFLDRIVAAYKRGKSAGVAVPQA